MASLNDIRKKLEQLNRDKILEIVGTILNDSYEAGKLNRAQLAKGIDAQGKEIDYTYSAQTIARKKKKSGLSGVYKHLTNYDTGDSYEALYIKVEKDKIIFGTDTDKDQWINNRMKGKAFGLSPESKEIFLVEELKPEFIKVIRELTGLK
jgi:hypothetical protein